jgi:Pyruvate/2-oxoacid:ferredoxin oxidoreductase gamma subunit
MEREIIFTGVGGQGIQLMAKVLAQAVAADGGHAMLFGVYGGAMRGGPSESTLVIGDAPIEAPPIVPACWSIVAMDGASLPALLPKLRPGGPLFVDDRVKALPAAAIAVPATRLALESGNALGAGMIMLGAFVAHTAVVPAPRLVEAMRAALPPHRARMADANVALLERGADWTRTAGAV